MGYDPNSTISLSLSYTQPINGFSLILCCNSSTRPHTLWFVANLTGSFPHQLFPVSTSYGSSRSPSSPSRVGTSTPINQVVWWGSSSSWRSSSTKSGRGGPFVIDVMIDQHDLNTNLARKTLDLKWEHILSLLIHKHCNRGCIVVAYCRVYIGAHEEENDDFSTPVLVSSWRFFNLDGKIRIIIRI